MVFYPHSEHFWQIKEGLLPEKGQDYAENQPDGKDDGVDAIVSVTVPNHLFNICTLFFQFHFTPEYNKKWPDLFMAANNLVAQANRNYRCLLPRRRKNTKETRHFIFDLIIPKNFLNSQQEEQYAYPAGLPLPYAHTFCGIHKQFPAWGKVGTNLVATDKTLL